MKKLIALFSVIFLLFAGAVSGKDKDKEPILNAEGVYEEVVTMPNVSQVEIYKRAKSWILENMKTEDNNILFDDKEFAITNNGSLKIEGKKNIAWVIKTGATNFKLHVWSKDGRYKFRIDNVAAYIIVVEGNVVAPKTLFYSEFENSKQGKHCKQEEEEKMEIFIQAFKKGMEAPASDKDKW